MTFQPVYMRHEGVMMMSAGWHYILLTLPVQIIKWDLWNLVSRLLVDRVNNDLQEFHSNNRRTPGEPSVWGACPGSTGGLCQTDHGYFALVSNKLCKLVVTKMLIIRFVLYYCPQDLAFQFRLIAPHHQSCYYSLMTTCLAYMHWWWWWYYDTCYQQDLPCTDGPLLDQGTLLPQESTGRDEACWPCASRQFSGSKLFYIWTVTTSQSHIIRSIILVSPLSNHF